MKILVVLTGGTIGSSIIDKEVTVNSMPQNALINHYTTTYNNDVEFEVIAPINILSENISIDNWNAVANILYNIDYSKYNGVIITNGSDTLSYTSSLLGQLFSFVTVPIVMVASNYPLGNPKSNGYSNFDSAIEFIMQIKVCGVFVSYGSKEKTNIYLSTRITEADSFTDDYSPYGYVPFAEVENGVAKTIFHVTNPLQKTLLMPQKKAPKNKVILKNNIVLIHIYPNIDLNKIDIKGYKAVLLYLYHSATACVDGENSVVPFLKKCKNQKIPVYGASFKNTDINYSTTNILLKEKLIRLNNISKESAYTKLLIAYSQTDIKPQEYISQNCFFEHIIA